MAVQPPSEPQAIVIFGATGDLARRKLLSAFYHLFLEGLLPEPFGIIGYARNEMDDEEYRSFVHDAIEEFAKQPPSGKEWDAFASHLRYVGGEFADKGAMDHLVEDLDNFDDAIGGQAQRLFYAATPSSVYPDIVDRLGETGLAAGSKIVFEKPFGRDLESARELNAIIHSVFDENQIFRIDHYMGKETVQNILALRFANGLFEPVWNRRYIDHVQITVAEDIGINGRGAFYEQTGAIRDMIQTHLFQVMTFIAMEPPVSFEPDRLRDEKVKLLRATNVCDPERVVRGQYEGYLEEGGVGRASTVETFAAMELAINNWRWAGVPFFLRTGKKLGMKTSEITLVFKEVPYNVFRAVGIPPARRDHLTIRIQPDEGITVALNVKHPGPGLSIGRATMDFDYEREFHSDLLDAYELLMIEAMEGDHTLFLREDEVERAWEILDPVLQQMPVVQPYEPGSWGPIASEDLISPHHWHVKAVDRTG
ncbi:MAG: glucose-6-phosphate dehydrogenase [Actinomycetota bacterium]